MENSGMIPLFYHSDIEVAKNVLKACYYGGSRLLNLPIEEILLLKFLKT